VKDEHADRWRRALERRRQLKPTTWYVLCELLDRDEGPVTMTSRQMASAAGLGRDSARAALRELQASGLIARTDDRDNGGRFRRRAYVVLPPSAATRPAPENPPEVATPAQPRRRPSPATDHTVDQLSLLSDDATAP
jgi:predicted transcriptional regulator